MKKVSIMNGNSVSFSASASRPTTPGESGNRSLLVTTQTPPELQASSNIPTKPNGTSSGETFDIT